MNSRKYNGSAYFSFVVFEINRLNPRRVFSSYHHEYFRSILLDSLVSQQYIYIYIWWNVTHGSCLPSTRNLKKIYYRIAEITHNFQSYSVLRDTTLVQWLFLSIRKICIYYFTHHHRQAITSLRSDNLRWYSFKLPRAKWVRFSAQRYLVTCTIQYIIVSRLKLVRIQIMRDPAKITNFNVFIDNFTLINALKHEG